MSALTRWADQTLGKDSALRLLSYRSVASTIFSLCSGTATPSEFIELLTGVRMAVFWDILDVTVSKYDEETRQTCDLSIYTPYLQALPHAINDRFWYLGAAQSKHNAAVRAATPSPQDKVSWSPPGQLETRRFQASYSTLTPPGGPEEAAMAPSNCFWNHYSPFHRAHCSPSTPHQSFWLPQCSGRLNRTAFEGWLATVSFNAIGPLCCRAAHSSVAIAPDEQSCQCKRLSICS